jgi:chaperonin cofactor prefoldin
VTYVDVQQLQDREQKTLQTLQELDLEKDTLERELKDLEKEVKEIDDLEKR